MNFLICLASILRVRFTYGRYFFLLTMSRPILTPTQSLIKMLLGGLSTGLNRRGVELSTHVRLLLRLRMSGAIPPHPHGATAASGPGHPHCQGFTITLRHTTLNRTPLDEWSARRRDFYLTAHNTHTTQTFEPKIPASERPQNHTLDHAATGIGESIPYYSHMP